MGTKAELKTGDVYNPYKIFVGIFIPNCIAETNKLSQSAKLCFGKLSQFSGKDGKCFPKQETLAKGIGVKSIKQIHRCLNELEKAQLIRREKPTGKDKLMHKPDAYVFIWNNTLFMDEEEDDAGVDINVQSEDDTQNEDEKDTKNEKEGVPTMDKNVQSGPDINVQSEGGVNVQSNRSRTSTKVESYEIKPKGFKSNPKTDLQNINDLGISTGQDRTDPKDNNLGAQLPSTAKILKAKSKEPIRKFKKKKSAIPHKVLELNQPFFDLLYEYGVKMPGLTTKTYIRIDESITELREGTYFNGLPDLEEFYDRKITLEDFDRFCYHFMSMLNSKEYEPLNGGIKDSWRNWYFTRILYKGADGNSGAYSLFAKYLDNPPKKIQSQIKDTNPAYTKYIIEECKKHFGWDMSNGGRQDAIKCAKRLSQFFEDNKDKIHLFDTQYKFTNQQVGTLIEVLQRNESQDHPVKPIYLHTDLTYKTFLPEHLKRVGSMS